MMHNKFRLALIISALCSVAPVAMPVLHAQSPPAPLPSQLNEPQQEEFMKAYLKLPPEQRVKVWSGASSFGHYIRAKVDWRLQEQIRAALIVEGLDTVPYLAEVVRSGDPSHRVRALEILCDMDRYVSISKLLLPQVGPSIYVRVSKLGGRINKFQPVDGRRIGRSGYAAVEWAAAQQGDQALRFDARMITGLLKHDLEELPLQEQENRWRLAITKGGGLVAKNPDEANTRSVLDGILIARLPDSLPYFTELLRKDTDSSVIEVAIEDLDRADTCRMRLRATNVGRKAIDAIHSAIDRVDLKPLYKTQHEREDYWNQLSAQFLHDEFRLDPSSRWSLYILAFDSFYREKIMKNLNPYVGRGSAPPETRRFIGFLTRLDANFPSWQYDYCGSPADDEVMHPLFKAKIARYYEMWKQFEGHPQ
ncbi:MAG: hypothetical protein ACYDCM_02655 [Candidatus Acidiferrales bacterium]